MQHKQGEERNQMFIFRLGSAIAHDSFVLRVDAFVDAIDLKSFGFAHVLCEEEGRPPYNPGDLLQLYMYGYLNRIRTSRKLERRCTRNVELMRLLHDLHPSAWKITYFRSDNKKALKFVFRQFIAMTKHWGLLEGNLLATDGSMLTAVNSKKNNYNSKKITLHFGCLDQQLQVYLNELDKKDKQVSQF
jgi:transposase